MSIDNPVAMLAPMVLAQWIAVSGTLWLTWWAAQSRDAMPIRVVAMLLVIVPAVIMPILNYAIMADRSSIARTVILIGLAGTVIAVSRALLLIVWAAVSKDRSYLRTGGVIVAGLQIVGIGVQALPGLLRL